MKLFFIFLISISTFSSYSQLKFYSEADVLNYLNNKRNFTNSSTGVTLIFTEMGGRMTSNKGLNYFSPDVTLVNTTRAVVAYTSLTSGGTAQIIVDCSEEVVLDRSSRVAYVAERFETSRRGENDNNNNAEVDRSLINSKANRQIFEGYKAPLNKNNNDIKIEVKPLIYNIGEVRVIGKLQVAEYDYKEQVSWENAKKICLSIGKGWRLPTSDELENLIGSNYKDLNFNDGQYWSSTKINNKIISIPFSKRTADMGFIFKSKLSPSDLALFRVVKNVN
jgi:hypothetical protein